jgi:2-keto-4-pentenoate hydratase
MNASKIDKAARFLIKRRYSDNRSRLPLDLIPTTIDDAIAIQQASSNVIEDKVGGWKAGLPIGGKLIVAPIFSKMVHRSPVSFARLENGVVRIEPEIAFSLTKDLPASTKAYTDEEIMQSIGSACLAIELIENRYQGIENISHNEDLADCLFNQGICLGPEVSIEKAIVASEFELTLTQGEEICIDGIHPNQSPIQPLYWLANFLSRQGIGLKAGDIVTTGSFAGVLEVLPDQELTIKYSGLGTISLTINC